MIIFAILMFLLSSISSYGPVPGTPQTATTALTGNILQVGPGKPYSTISGAVIAAQSGDTIEIDAGVYANESMTIAQNNLNLRGVGGYAYLKWGTGDYLT